MLLPSKMANRLFNPQDVAANMPRDWGSVNSDSPFRVSREPIQADHIGILTPMLFRV